MSNMRENIDGAVLRAIQTELDRQVTDIIVDAEERVCRAIHRIVANAAITAHDYYNIERRGDNLVISVKIMNSALDRLNSPEKP